MESRLLEDFQSLVGRLNCKSKIQKLKGTTQINKIGMHCIHLRC